MLWKRGRYKFLDILSYEIRLYKKYMKFYKNGGSLGKLVRN